jgi:phytoene desaturase
MRSREGEDFEGHFLRALSAGDAESLLTPDRILRQGSVAEHEQAGRKAIERLLEETVLPGLSKAIVTSRFTTPQDFQDNLNAYRGAGFGLEPVLTQSAWFRPHNLSEDVRNLFLVGAGTHPGAGLPGVLSSARVLDKVVPDVSVFA